MRAALAGLLLAAVAAPAGAAEPLRVVLGAEPTSMDPSIDTLKSSLVIANTMLETLAMNTPDQTFVPWLAESWESVGPTRWRLKLKRGVKFHNGEPFDAEAVIYSVKVFRETKGLARGWFGFLAGAERVDDHTVDLVTTSPTAIVPSSLAFLYALPPKHHAQVGSEGFARKPVGTGPWRFVSWTPGVQFKVEPFAGYWGKKPAVGEIHFRWAPEGSSRVALLETGEVHLAQNIPPVLAERVERSGAARIESVKSIRKVFIQLNIYEGPTADVRVRRALNHAVDVESIIRTLFRGRAYGRDKGIILEGFEGYQGATLQPFKHDPDLAKRLLAEAGHPNGFSTTLWHPVGRYMLDKEASQAIAGQLARVGVKAELQGMESGAYFSKVSKEKVPGLNFFACGALYMNPLFCSLVHLQPGAAFAYGANERTAQFIKRATETLDAAARAKVYQEFENYVYKEQVPWIWLWHQQDIYGASNKVNWKARSDELMTFEEVSFR
jgi:peptide/nickel transport system substrate-binding protein